MSFTFYRGPEDSKSEQRSKQKNVSLTQAGKKNLLLFQGPRSDQLQVFSFGSYEYAIKRPLCIVNTDILP